MASQEDLRLHSQRSDDGVPHTVPTQAIQTTSRIPQSSFTNPSYISKLPRAHLLSVRTKRLQYEIQEMRKHPVEHGSAGPKGESMDHWAGVIHGPPNTPYEGGNFFIKIDFPDQYPYKPPQLTLLTRIYHCNINSKGVICMDILKERWVPSVSLSKLFYCVSVLLTECNPYDPLVGDIAELYIKNRAEHDRIAQVWTEKFAC